MNNGIRADRIIRDVWRYICKPSVDEVELLKEPEEYMQY